MSLGSMDVVYAIFFFFFFFFFFYILVHVAFVFSFILKRLISSVKVALIAKSGFLKPYPEIFIQVL